MISLKYKEKISVKKCKELIFDMVKYGDHRYPVPALKNLEELARYLSSGNLDLQTIVSKCVNYSELIPNFENLASAINYTMSSDAENVKTSLINSKSGKPETEFLGSGMIAPRNYLAQFENAKKDLQSAMANFDGMKLVSSITLGITSIESYIRYRVNIWNKNKPTDKLLDSKETKVSFEDKINIWVPKMAGKKLDKGDVDWAKYKILRGFRDDLVIHIKESSLIISENYFLQAINNFRNGVCGMLRKLHLLFNEKIPSRIIRGYYSPEAVR